MHSTTASAAEGHLAEWGRRVERLAIGFRLTTSLGAFLSVIELVATWGIAGMPFAGRRCPTRAVAVVRSLVVGEPAEVRRRCSE